MAKKRDYYEVLGISKSASETDIKRAFRNLAMKHHPDKDKSIGAEERFKEINEAYEVLSDPEKKSKYDQFGFAGYDGSKANGNTGAGGFGGFGQGFGGRGFGSFEEIFKQFGDFDFGGLGGFGQGFGGFGKGSSNMPRQGSHITSKLTISFVDSLVGITKNLNVNHEINCDLCEGKGYVNESDKKTCDKCKGNGQITVEMKSPLGVIRTTQPCSKCNGTGSIIKNQCKKCKGSGSIKERELVEAKIPAGIEDGQTVRILNKGNSGINGGPSGHLYLEVEVDEHEYFERHENDLYLNFPISLSQLIIGTTLKVSIPNEDITIKVPSMTKPGSKLRSKNHGFPILGTRSKGDLYIILDPIMPKNLSIENKKKIKKAAESNQKDTNAFSKKLKDSI